MFCNAATSNKPCNIVPARGGDLILRTKILSPGISRGLTLRSLVAGGPATLGLVALQSPGSRV